MFTSYIGAEYQDKDAKGLEKGKADKEKVKVVGVCILEYILECVWIQRLHMQNKIIRTRKQELRFPIGKFVQNKICSDSRFNITNISDPEEDVFFWFTEQFKWLVKGKRQTKRTASHCYLDDQRVAQNEVHFGISEVTDEMGLKPWPYGLASSRKQRQVELPQRLALGGQTDRQVSSQLRASCK